jgi:hypothetical protein
VDPAQEVAGRRLARLVQHLVGDPRSRIRPDSRKHTSSATCVANPISWVAMTIVIPSALRSRTVASTSLTRTGSSAEVTSSMSISRGDTASERTMATRCCCPPESRSGYWRALSARPKRSSSTRPAASACSRGTLCTLRMARVMLSSTRQVREEVERLEHHADAGRRTSSGSTSRVGDVVGRRRMIPSSIR